MAAQWIGKMQSDNGLIKSYANPKEDFAWTYDQALALLVLTKTDQPKATKLVEALVQLQNPSGSWYDGYLATSMKPATDNQWIGSVSWVVYAICQYIDAGGDKKYITAAKRGVDWLVSQQQPDGKLHISTEGNLDAWWAFQAVGYKKEAIILSNYLLKQVWNDNEGRFHTGTSDNSIYLDPQTWGSEFLRANGASGKAKRALDFAYLKLKVTLADGSLSGFDTAGPYTIWNEGTAQYVSANGKNKQFYLNELSRQQNPDGSMNHSPENFERPGVWHVNWPSVAATAWYYFAQTGSPFHKGVCRGAK